MEEYVLDFRTARYLRLCKLVQMDKIDSFSPKQFPDFQIDLPYFVQKKIVTKKLLWRIRHPGQQQGIWCTSPALCRATCPHRPPHAL